MIGSTRHPFSLWAGCLLLVLSAIGMVQSGRAAIAQALYRQTAFSASPLSPESAAAAMGRAERLYAHGYRFCLWTAEHLHEAAGARSGEESSRWRGLAEYWTDRGLAHNPFNVSLHIRKTLLLVEHDPQAALEYWRAYVNWHFWDAYHHALLVDLYVLTGDAQGARDSLRFIENTPYFKAAHTKIRRLERQTEMQSISDRLLESLLPSRSDAADDQ